MKSYIYIHTTYKFKAKEMKISLLLKVIWSSYIGQVPVNIHTHTYMHAHVHTKDSNTTDPASQFMKTDEILLSISDCNTYIFTNEVYCKLHVALHPSCSLCDACIPEDWHTNHNTKPKLVSHEQSNIMKGSIPNDQRNR